MALVILLHVNTIPIRASALRCEYASADWQYFFKFRYDLENVTPADVERVAKTYPIQSNRTYGEYIPTENSILVQVPNRDANPRAAMQGYQGRKKFSEGQDFNATN